MAPNVRRNYHLLAVSHNRLALTRKRSISNFRSRSESKRQRFLLKHYVRENISLTASVLHQPLVLHILLILTTVFAFADNHTMQTTPFFLLGPVFLTVACSTSLFFWRLYEDQIVTDYDTVTSTSSEMACVRECMTRSRCDSCAYDRESGTCYLQVQTGVATEVTSNNTAVFKAVYPCKEPLGHDAGNTADVLWSKNGWELEGNVICDDDDYMYIGDSPTYRCSSLGKWTANPWECRRRIWRNPATRTRFNVPKPPEPGWSVCVNGTPTAATRFSINFLQNEENFVLHADFRQHHNGRLSNEITLGRKVDNEWEGEVSYNDLTPFPLAVNRTFIIVIKAPTLYEIQLFVDGTFVGNYTTLTSVDRVTKVFAGADVIIDMIDLWCDQ